MYCIRKRDEHAYVWLYLAYKPYPDQSHEWVILSPMTRPRVVDYEYSCVGEVTKFLTKECQLVKLDFNAFDYDDVETPIVRLDHSFKLKNA